MFNQVNYNVFQWWFEIDLFFQYPVSNEAHCEFKVCCFFQMNHNTFKGVSLNKIDWIYTQNRLTCNKWVFSTNLK